MKKSNVLQRAFSEELEEGEGFACKLACSSGPSYRSMAITKADPACQPEDSSSAGGLTERVFSCNTSPVENPLIMQSETALGPALQLSPEAKGKAIAEMPAQEANDMTCAICLDQIAVADLCAIKGCDHVYCGKCILAWTVHRDPPSCPQCKAPFTFLLTFRKLDGTLSDYAVEESVCLLKRAHWFEAHLKEMEKGKALLPALPEDFGASVFTADDAREWQEWHEYSQDYSRYEYEIEEDEEVEAYYYSSAAGRARILGNRRFGENGYIASGRMQARPVVQSSRAGSKGKAKAATAGSASKQAASSTPAKHTGGSETVGAASPASASDVCITPMQSQTGKKQAACDTPGSSGGGGGKGRRAHRKEKRASADARARMLSSP